MEESIGGGEGRFRILLEASVAADLSKEPFNDSTAGMNSIADLIRRFTYDLDGVDHRNCWLVAGIARVGESFDDEREGPCHSAPTGRPRACCRTH